MKLGIAGPIRVSDYSSYLNNLSSLNPSLPKGLGGTSVVSLTLGLLDQGYKLVIFTLDFSVSKEVILEGPNVKICIGPYRARHRARDFFKVERTYLEEAIQRERPDIVNAHWTYEFALGSLASGLPTIVTAHDAPLRVLQLTPTPYWFMRILMSYNVVRQTQYLTAVSQHIAEHFRRFLFYTGPIKVIPNGLRDDLFEMGKKRPREKRDILTFAVVSNYWGRLKNNQVALKAFKQVHEIMPQTKLLMFGTDHGEGEEASIWARQRGLDKGVEFRGVLPHEELLHRLVNEVDVLIHLSLEESFCMAIAEAMALGIPAIGGKNSGAVPFILEHGKVGLLVDVRSPESVAEAMLRLAHDPTLRSKLGQSAWESAQRRFHIAKVAKAYIEAYEEVLSKKGR